MTKCLIIAEVGVNHNGSFEIAKQYIQKVAEVGADVVKFQTFRAENLVTADAPKAEYQARNLVKQGGQYEMLKSLEFTYDEHRRLRDFAREVGIEYLSTPFDEDALQFLIGELNVGRIKIPSGEITNAPMLVRAGRWRKPLILSTGMSTLEDVKRALGALAFGMCTTTDAIPSPEAFEQAFCSPHSKDILRELVTILHCTTEYPAPFRSVNLLAMNTLKNEFNLPVGLSDHSEGIAVPIAAVSIGAKVIEKHVTFDRSLPGPDHKASLEMGDFAELVTSIREVEMAMGSGAKEPTLEERRNILVVRKSIVAKTRISKGEFFGWHNLAFKRPGTGHSPFAVYDMIGKRAARAYEKDEIIK